MVRSISCVFVTRPLNTLSHHTLTTYLRLFSHTLSPPPISIWATGNHYQLLLNHSLSLPSITQHLLPLPTIPLHNTNRHNNPIIIKAPSRSKYMVYLLHTTIPFSTEKLL